MQVSNPIHRPLGRRVGSPLGNGPGLTLPRQNRVAYIPNAYPFVDKDGANTRTLYNLQYINAPVDGVNLWCIDLVGYSVASKNGTATINTGSSYYVKISNGWISEFSLLFADGKTSVYKYAVPTAPTKFIVPDISGNGRHLSAFQSYDSATVCASGREVGTDWLNQKGYSNAENLVLWSENMSKDLWVLLNNSGSAVKTSNSISLQKLSDAAAKDTIYQTNGGANWAGDSMYLHAGTRYIFGASIDAISPNNGMFTIRLSDTNDGVQKTFPITLRDGFQYGTIVPGVSGNAKIYLESVDRVKPIITATGLKVHINIDATTIANHGTVVMLGDSLTYQNTAKYLQQYIPTSTVIDKGVTAKTLVGSFVDWQTDVLDHNPDHIHVWRCINDIANGTVYPVDNMMSEIESMGASARANNITISFGNCTAFGGAASWTQTKQNWLEEFSSRLLAYCALHDHEYVDMYSISKDPASVSLDSFIAQPGDFLHAITAGYMVYARHIAEQLFPRSYPGEETYAKTDAFPVYSPCMASPDGVTNYTGSPLQYPGSAKQNLVRTSGTGTNLEDAGTYTLPDSHTFRESIGWTYGVDHWAYTSLGVPKEVSGAVIKANGLGPRLYVGTKGIALYAVTSPQQRIVCDGTGEFACAYLLGTETITDANKGTSTLTIAAGKITATAGTAWSFTLSNGSRYEYATKLDSTRAIVFDISGNDRHLIMTGFADLDAACVAGYPGSDWINQGGHVVSDGTFYIDDVSFGAIPNGIVIPALADGSGCCAYVVGG